MRKLAKLVPAASLLVAGCATPPANTRLPRVDAPKLVIVIVVDQLSADLFDEYRPQFTGGLARLAGGTWFRNGYQSHASTETCPGHATILTGARPATTGIIGNAWIDRSVGRGISCAEVENPPNTSSSNYTVSSVQLNVPTLGELLRKALMPPPFCADKAQPVTIEGGRVVGNGAFARAAGDSDVFRASPDYDSAVLAQAGALVSVLQLGGDATPDLLAIGLSATDYVGHAYGTGGQWSTTHFAS